MNDVSCPFVVVDVGNTVLHWGMIVTGDSFISSGRISHPQAYDLGFELAQIDPQPQKVIVASVNPRVLPDLCEGIKKNLGFECLVLQAGQNWHPQIDVDRPQEVGIDRLLNARALKESCAGGGIVIDHGTALTIDYVAAGGVYSGGTIVPGVALAARSLAEKTALIPYVSQTPPRSVVGKNTTDCVNAGLYYGFLGLVEALVKRIRYEKGEDLPVFVTGGDSAFIAEQGEAEGWQYSPFLTLEGLHKASQDAQWV